MVVTIHSIANEYDDEKINGWEQDCRDDGQKNAEFIKTRINGRLDGRVESRINHSTKFRIYIARIHVVPLFSFRTDSSPL